MPLEPDDEDEELLDELLELEELLDEEDEDEEDEELPNPDEEDELLELELDEVEVVSPPPHATKLSANRHELAIVTGRCQPTSVFIEDIFTYLYLVNTHCELKVFFRYQLFVSLMPELTPTIIRL